jgi:hypothetical protein
MTLSSYLWPGVHTDKPNDADALEGLSPVPSPVGIRIAVEGETSEPEQLTAKVESRLIS